MLPGPFLPGQRVTAGQLNDATQKTIASVDVNIDFPIPLVSGVTTTETTVTQFTLGPLDQVAGALYRVDVRANIQQTVATDEFFMIMRKNTPLTGTIVAGWDMFATTKINGGFWFLGWADFPAIVDEAGVTYYFSVVRVPGIFAGSLIVWGHNPNDTRSITPSGVKISRVGYASEYTVVT